MHEELIKRLEDATEGIRDLDAEIAIAVRARETKLGKRLPEWAFKNFEPWGSMGRGRVGCVHNDGTFGLNWEAIHYTTSIDAGKTLLTPGTLWAVGSMEDGPFARLVMPNDDGGYVGGSVEASANTPELAFVAAILKARKAEE